MAMRMRIRELIVEKGLREGRDFTQKEVALAAGIAIGFILRDSM